MQGAALPHILSRFVWEVLASGTDGTKTKKKTCQRSNPPERPESTSFKRHLSRRKTVPPNTCVTAKRRARFVRGYCSSMEPPAVKGLGLTDQKIARPGTWKQVIQGLLGPEVYFKNLIRSKQYAESPGFGISTNFLALYFTPTKTLLLFSIS